MMNKWNSKKIAFISMLIAMSISFVIIGAQTAAISSFPSIKLSLAGLPIKIIGYLFGPIIGLIIGFITDILSFIFIPVFYFPMYSLALGITGMLPGFSALFYNYFYKKINTEKKIKKFNSKIILINHKLKDLKDDLSLDKFNSKLEYYNKKIEKVSLDTYIEKNKKDFAMYSAIVITILLMIIVSVATHFIPDSAFNDYFNDKGILKFLKNRIYFILLIVITLLICIIMTIAFRFTMKTQTYLRFVPILVFVLFTEYINLPIIAYADSKTVNINFMISYISSLFTSPIKIWMNLLIISFTLKIVTPLMEKKAFNGYL